MSTASATSARLASLISRGLTRPLPRFVLSLIPLLSDVEKFGYQPAAAESKMDRSMLSFAQWHPAWVPREQSTSVYLSQIQQQPRNQPRPTRFAGAGMASTALINEERQAENWTSQPEPGSGSQRGGITPRQVGSPSDRDTESSAGPLEEDGLGESYEDGHVLKQRKGSVGDDHEQGKGPHSLVNMLLNDPPNARGW